MIVQSILFVPGARPERFPKALATAADCVCIDLEDSVPADGKDMAREAALAAVGDDPRLAIRINGLRTRHGMKDLLALAESERCPARIFIPMVEDPAELRLAHAILQRSETALVPLIETIEGVEKANAIAAEQGVSMVMLGGADLAAQIGAPVSWEALLHARSRLVMACAGAGRKAIDVPFIRLDDPMALTEECARAKALGFAAKAAIHPAQIEHIHTIFRPTPAEFEEAEAAARAYAEAGGSVVRFRGKMLEAPVMAHYQQVLDLRGRMPETA